MLKTYLLVALRNLRRRRGYAVLNGLGLAVGIASTLLILLFVVDELGYDRQHPHAERLYRLTNATATAGDVMHVAISPARYPEAAAAELPEVEAFARLHPPIERLMVRSGEHRFFEEEVLYADSSFFDVFGFPLAHGDVATALREPFSIVVTPAFAEKYFGTTNPMGQTLRVNEAFDITVTGVLAGPPERSHVDFEALLSMATLAALSDVWLYGTEGPFFTSWDLAAGYGYVRLAEGADPLSVGRRLTELVMRNVEAGGSQYTVSLQPVTDIHLRSDVLYDVETNGDEVHVWVLLIVALFMVGIAAINYVNLATARSLERATEVGVRKAVGAGRAQLARQFLTESIVLAVLSVAVALVLALAALPLFNGLTSKALGVTDVLDVRVLPLLLLGGVGLGLLAGLYPAFVLSSFRPVEVLKSARYGTGGGGALRKGLVVFQFTATVVLLIGTAVVAQQLRFFQSRDLGFDQEQVVYFRLPGPEARARVETLKERLAAHPGVVSAAAGSGVPALGAMRHDAKPAGRPEDERWLMAFYGVDFDFVETMGFELVAGRSFDRRLATDSTQAYLVNETAVRRLGWEGDAVGREFAWIRPGVGVQEGRVVGVVQDFHYEALRQPIEPAFFAVAPDWLEVVAVRLRPEEVPATLAHVERVWEGFFPAYPFDFTFLDETIAEGYERERRFGRVFGVFAALTMFVACLGLVGLAAFTAEQRRKEVGVRKVLGASTRQLVLLLTRDVVALVLVAFAVAAPLAWVAMGRWLEGFAYRVALGPAPFLAAGALALAVALATVGVQALRAATADPVKALRTE